MPTSSEFWLPLLLTLALSTGALTLIMFWEALLGIRLSLLGITVPYLALMLPGWWFRRPRWPAFHPPQSRFERLAGLLLAIICAGILFNSLYWPFSRADAVGIYAHFAEYMAEQRTIAPLAGDLTVYEAYPPFMSLNYSYAYLASGWFNEYLARLFPALLSLGCLGAIYVLGKQMYSRLAGWLAVLLLLLTPAFVSWASSGYVDLPMAFFYALAAVFAARLRTSRHWRDALLAGAMMGLAAWTKNAALLGVLFLALWLLWIRLNWKLIFLALGTCALIAAPWYLRNLIEAGLILPPTAWTDQSQHTLSSLLVLLNHPQDYALSGFCDLPQCDCGNRHPDSPPLQCARPGPAAAVDAALLRRLVALCQLRPALPAAVSAAVLRPGRDRSGAGLGTDSGKATAAPDDPSGRPGADIRPVDGLGKRGV